MIPTILVIAKNREYNPNSLGVYSLVNIGIDRKDTICAKSVPDINVII
jgi:hypothetical protein